MWGGDQCIDPGDSTIYKWKSQILVIFFLTHETLCNISGFHDGDYEEEPHGVTTQKMAFLLKL
jgi:hypothetical protein